MSRATITYTSAAGAYVFTDAGRTMFARRSDLDPEPSGAKAQREVTTWSIKQEFDEKSFADNHAREAALRLALSAPEGMLTILDERGTEIFSGNVRVINDNLPEQWGSYLMEVEVAFRSIRTDLNLSPFNASFTPTGGTAILLPNVMSIRDGVRTERPVTNVDNRRETMITFNLSGRIQADMKKPEAQRRSDLLAAKAAIIAARNCPNGTLVFGSETHVVRIDQIDAELADISEQLVWSLNASYRAFPDGADVAVEYEVDQKYNEERSELVTTVSGTVKCKSKAAAETRAGLILTQYVAGRVLLSQDIKNNLLDNADGVDGWLTLTFNYTFREALNVLSWDLTISTRDDLKSANVIIIYSGKVTAATSAAALTQARSVGDGKYPLRMTATETVVTKSVAGSAAYFVECSFSYEYLTKGVKIFAEVTSETKISTFGNSSQTISGFVASSDGSVSTTTALGFQLSGRLLRDETMTSEDIHQETDSVDQHVKVSFSFTYFLAHSAGSIQYTLEVDNDYESRQCTATYAGTAWGSSSSATDTLINSLVSGESGSILRDRRSSSIEVAQSITGFVSEGFSLSFVRPLSAKAGEDILNAEYSLEITYSISMSIFTNIPYGAPFQDEDVYQSPSSISINGRVDALTEASARAWAIARYALIAGGGFTSEPPALSTTYHFLKKSGTVISFYTCSFRYSGKRPTLFLTS